MIYHSSKWEEQRCQNFKQFCVWHFPLTTCSVFSRESVLLVVMGVTTATLTSRVLLTQRTSDGCSVTVEISFSECTSVNTSYCDVPGRGVTRTISWCDAPLLLLESMLPVSVQGGLTGGPSSLHPPTHKHTTPHACSQIAWSHGDSHTGRPPPPCVCMWLYHTGSMERRWLKFLSSFFCCWDLCKENRTGMTILFTQHDWSPSDHSDWDAA